MKPTFFFLTFHSPWRWSGPGWSLCPLSCGSPRGPDRPAPRWLAWPFNVSGTGSERHRLEVKEPRTMGGMETLEAWGREQGTGLDWHQPPQGVTLLVRTNPLWNGTMCAAPAVLATLNISPPSHWVLLLIPQSWDGGGLKTSGFPPRKVTCGNFSAVFQSEADVVTAFAQAGRRWAALAQPPVLSCPRFGRSCSCSAWRLLLLLSLFGLMVRLCSRAPDVPRQHFSHYWSGQDPEVAPRTRCGQTNSFSAAQRPELVVWPL